MINADYEILKDIAESENFSSKEQEEISYANISLYLKDMLGDTLSTVSHRDIIGFSEYDYLEIGQRFENPFSKDSFFEVVEFDAKEDRALIELVMFPKEHQIAK